MKLGGLKTLLLFTTFDLFGHQQVVVAAGKHDIRGLSQTEKTLAEKFAPIVWLHPMDMHMPGSFLEHLKDKVTLRDSQKNVLVENPTPNDLVNSDYNQDGNYLHYKGPRPNGKNTFSTGMPIKKSASDSNMGICDAPTYVNVLTAGHDVWRIVYAFWYPFNGCQTLRAGYRTSGFSWTTKKRNIEFCPFGRHEGDFEFVTLFVKKSNEKLLGMYISQHGHAVFKYPDGSDAFQMENGHPIVYSALNSHANYYKIETKKMDGIIGAEWGWLTNLPLTGGIAWANAADTTSTEGTVTHKKPSPYYSKVRWETKNYVVLVEDDTDLKNALSFMGNYGDRFLDNSSVRYPPDGLPGTMAANIYELAIAASAVGAIPDKFMKGGGPRGPIYREWWQSKCPLPEDLIQWNSIHMRTFGKTLIHSQHGVEIYDSTSSDQEILIGFGGRVASKRFTRILLCYHNLVTGQKRYKAIGGSVNKQDYEEYVEIPQGHAMVGFAAAVDNNNLASVSAYYRKIEPTNLGGHFLFGEIKKMYTGNNKEEMKYLPNISDTKPIVGIGISSAKERVDGIRIWVANFKRV